MIISSHDMGRLLQTLDAAWLVGSHASSNLNSLRKGPVLGS